jgi:filamentous hemagglutinin family protein
MPEYQRACHAHARPASIKSFLLGCSALTVAAQIISPAHAGPQGASYDRTQVSVSQSGNTTNVQQSANRAVIDWQSFNVGRQETVQFNQPGASSSTLNRVRAGQESVIAGRITAPGQVIIQNSNGVVFTNTARVDVGSLIATSVGISERNFFAGRMVFDEPGNPSAVVRNEGTITVAEKGLVAFVAPGVANTGLIVAKAGTVALAAGNAVTLDLYGDGLISVAVTDPVTQKPRDMDTLVAQGGVIQADGGRVVLTAEAASGLVNSVINMSGVIQARGVSVKSGQVALVSASGGIQVAGSIDARGDAAGGAGGTVDVVGRDVTLTAGSRIDVSAVGAGDGGVVRAIAAERGRYDGAIVANGAGGKRGGKVETSARTQFTVGESAFVSTASPGGTVGEWLIDPVSITVVGSGGTAGSVSGANGAAGASTINASTIVNALALGSVTLLASDLIDVTAAINATSLGGSPRGLQLIADGPTGRVRIGAPIVLAGGNVAVRAVSNIELASGGVIDVGSGTVWLQTGTNGTITQAAGSAIRSGALGALAADVSLTSWDNNVGTLAGIALNGNFQFNQTNATGVTNIGTVSDPFATQTLAGVAAQTRTLQGSLDFTSTTSSGTQTLTFTLGGASFDTVVFTALRYTVPSATDSSDYFVQSVGYALAGGGVFTIDPNTGAGGRPAGFAVTGEQGPAVVDAGRWGVGAFTSLGPTNQNEIQHNVATGASEALTVRLGGSTQSLNVTLSQFYNPEPGGTGIERGRASFYQTTASAVVIGTRITSSDGGGGGGGGGQGSGNSNPFATNGFTEPQFRGRDPDTPGDAVYRTTRLENPYIENPYLRSYALGSSGVSADQVSPEALSQIAPAAGPPMSRPLFPKDADNDHVGQHADRTAEPEVDLAAVNIGPLEDLAAALALIVPAAGPNGNGIGNGATTPQAAPSCSSGSFMRDFWICYPPASAANSGR